MLWLVWVASNTCMWMNDVAAAWVMTSLTTSPTLIALVQTASSMPVFLLGLPSGALADILDRRRYFMVTQFWIATNAAIIFTVALLDALTAPILLMLVFTNGIGLAMRWPVYSAILPEVVGRAQIGEALALNAVAVNTSRVVGPLMAGFIISAAGDAFVFAVNFVVSVIAGIVLYRWKRETKPSVLPGERFIGAMRLGFQFVRESRRMRDALVRTAVFFVHSTAIFALLPLVAAGLEGGAPEHTVLRIARRRRGHGRHAAPAPRGAGTTRSWSPGTMINAFGIAVLAVAPSVWVASRRSSECQASPDPGGELETVAAQLASRPRAAWRSTGWNHGRVRVRRDHLGKARRDDQHPREPGVAAFSMVVALAFSRVTHARGSGDHTPHPLTRRSPRVDLREGPVMVTIEYQIDPGRSDEFDQVMADTRSARLRAGAVSWGLFEDLQRPGRWVEYFACNTWADYLRRFDRFTAADERLQQRRHALHIAEGPPRISRFVARHPPG
jgi:MFS family permease